MTLGEKIQELRRRSGMSQDVLAEKLEVSRQAVSKWERDEAMPETDKIVRIAQLFGVSTDYLLMPQPPRQEPPAQPGRGHSWERRLDRFVRRHGYKAGYALIAWGAVLCAIALLVMILVPALTSGFMEMGKIPQNGLGGGIFVEGDADIPQDVLDEMLGGDQSGFGGFADMENMYNQQVDQMSKVWQGGVRIVTAIFGVPILLFGILLISAGVIVIRKGKLLAKDAQ